MHTLEGNKQDSEVKMSEFDLTLSLKKEIKP